MERAKRHEEMIFNPAVEDAEATIPKRVELNRKFEDKKRRIAKEVLAVTPELAHDAVCRRRRKLCELSIKEKLEIAHKYLIEHYPLADIAQLYQVKPETVRKFAKKVEKDDKVLAELHLVEEKKAEKKAAIIRVAVKLDKTVDGILKAEDVVYEVKQVDQLEVSL